MGFLKGASLLSHAILSVALQAQDPSPRFQFSGFGTLGLVATGTRQVGYPRNDTEAAYAVDQPTAAVDSRLGLQWSARLSDKLLFTLQVLSKNQYDNTWRPEVDWACLNWTPTPDWQIKGGRIGTQELPNGDFANVGYTYLWVRPPAEVFNGFSTSFINGLDVTRSFQRPDGTTYAVQVIGGFADEKQVVDNSFDRTYDLSGSYLWGVALKAARGGFRGKLSYSQFRAAQGYGGATVQDFLDLLASYSTLLNNPTPAQVANSLNLQGALGRNILLGVSWEDERIQAQAGLGRNLLNLGAFPSGWLGYASFGYAFGNLMPYAVWARTCSDHQVLPDLSAISALPGPLPPAVVQTVDASFLGGQSNQSTVSAGLRWDLGSHAALKLQVDRVRAHDSTVLWRVLQPGWDGEATVMSLALDFIFGGFH